ncbi:MAG: hypothetical protein ACR2QM_14765 [Longimicrobiales bacterium]
MAALAFAVAMPSSAQEVATVSIEAVCSGDGALESVSINPWTLKVPVPGTATNRNVQVEWVLTNSSPDSIAIHAKDRGHWPFGFAEMRGSGQGRARAPKARMLGRLPMRGGNSNARRVRAQDKFRYDVVFYCTAGDGSPYTVTVDPDIDIGN